MNKEISISDEIKIDKGSNKSEYIINKSFLILQLTFK